MKITKQSLEQLYIQEKKSVKQISNVLCKSPSQVSRYLRKYNIPTRDFSTKGLHLGLGKVLSQETRDKISQTHIGKKLSPEHRLKVIKTLAHGKGKDNPNFKGGRIKTNEGYYKILINGKYIYEHRYIVECSLDRKLNQEEHIHHINENKIDNRLDNLLIVSESSHQIIHWSNGKRVQKQSNTMKNIRANKFWSTKRK